LIGQGWVTDESSASRAARRVSFLFIPMREFPAVGVWVLISVGLMWVCPLESC